MAQQPGASAPTPAGDQPRVPAPSAGHVKVEGDAPASPGQASYTATHRSSRSGSGPRGDTGDEGPARSRTRSPQGGDGLAAPLSPAAAEDAAAADGSPVSLPEGVADDDDDEGELSELFPPQAGVPTLAEAAAVAAFRDTPSVLQQLGGRFGAAFSASSEPSAGLGGGAAGSQAPAPDVAGAGVSVPDGDVPAPTGVVTEDHARHADAVLFPEEAHALVGPALWHLRSIF